MDIAVAARLPESPPDFAGIIRRAALDQDTRFKAETILVDVLMKAQPLSADHGSHLVRASNLNSCSLELLARKFSLLDLPRGVDKQMTMDAGTIWGAWLGALLAAAAEVSPKSLGFAVGFEIEMEYRGCKGHSDCLIIYTEGKGHKPYAYEPLEIKTTPSSAELKPPDARKLYQCVQTATYALDPRFGCERFNVLTWGPNVTNNRAGEPYDRLVVHTYKTADFKPLVDVEVDRLTVLDKLTTEFVDQTDKYADAKEDYLCKSCQLSACSRNQNPARFAL